MTAALSVALGLAGVARADEADPEAAAAAQTVETPASPPAAQGIAAWAAGLMAKWTCKVVTVSLAEAPVLAPPLLGRGADLLERAAAATLSFAFNFRLAAPARAPEPPPAGCPGLPRLLTQLGRSLLPTPGLPLTLIGTTASPAARAVATPRPRASAPTRVVPVVPAPLGGPQWAGVMLLGHF